MLLFSQEVSYMFSIILGGIIGGAQLEKWGLTGFYGSCILTIGNGLSVRKKGRKALFCFRE